MCKEKFDEAVHITIIIICIFIILNAVTGTSSWNTMHYIYI